MGSREGCGGGHEWRCSDVFFFEFTEWGVIGSGITAK